MPKVFNETPSTVLKPFWKTKDSSLKLYHGDVIEVLNKLPEQSVQMCVTSPPYYGLRCYDGTATWEGGDESCDHVIDKRSDPSRLKSKDGHAPVAGCPTRDTTQVAKSHCGKCGAKRIDKQIGSEETIDQFVEKMVEVFRAVKRVLRDDGTCWINLGDSYASSSYSEKRTRDITDVTHKDNYTSAFRDRMERNTGKNIRVKNSLKAGNLIGAPWRVALALQADGWVLRQDIIWAKGESGDTEDGPGPVMPQSVKNRYATAHEYLFLMTKKMGYFFDHEASREQGSTDPEKIIARVKASQASRNRRSVWRVNAENYGGSHFATFPTKLVEPCILAGSKPGHVVLDPFVGSGTTLCVAMAHDRRGVGIDLSETYLKNNAIPRIEGALMSRPGKAHLVQREVKKIGGGVSLIK